MLCMRAARTVTTFASYVPFRDLIGVNVVIDGVAAIAGGPGRTLHVVGRIVGFPPVGALGYKIGLPGVMRDVPLCGLREIIVADFRKVALLPDAPVDQCHIF